MTMNTLITLREASKTNPMTNKTNDTGCGCLLMLFLLAVIGLFVWLDIVDNF